MSQSQGQSQGFSQGMSQGLSQGLSQGSSQGFSQGLSQGMSQGLSQGMSQGISQGISQGMSQGYGGGLLPLVDPGVPLGRTGAGMSSGNGFLGGYGLVPRSGYATAAMLGPKPWALDFLVAGGQEAYPTRWRVSPYDFRTRLDWRTEDWDPALRFWSLPFDPNLTEWLQDTDLAAPSVMVAREWARQHAKWQHHDDSLPQQTTALVNEGWLTQADVEWAGWTSASNPNDEAAARTKIDAELESLVILMHDSRASYLTETLAQSDGVGPYFMHLLAADPLAKPWTWQLFQCAVAISNVTYMYFKDRFKRVRPSRLCPGLVPPFGPPQHPAFPSGHSTLGHVAALLFLQVEGIAATHGVGIGNGELGTAPPLADVASDAKPLDGSLFWLAARLAKNRERIGVHYASDSSAGRHLAGGIARALFGDPKATPTVAPTIELPTLNLVLERARAEWPLPKQRY